MTTERYVRMFAGIFILASLLLAYLHSRYWLWLTTFVGFTLLQSSLTCFCPMEKILKKVCTGGSCCQHKTD
jgi:hypothetical protein